MNNKPMNLLILEDEEYILKTFINLINKRTDINLVGYTSSCEEALFLVKTNNIEGIVLDIELHEGMGGSGLNFLADLNKIDLDIKPIIIVTTNISSKRVYNMARSLGADLIFCKNQKDYNIKVVLNTFIMLRETIVKDINKDIMIKTNNEILEDRKNLITKLINNELDLIGMSYHLKGRQYIFDALYYLIDNKDGDQAYLNFLSNKYKKVNSTISNAIQVSINHVWKNTPYDDLEKHFTARISYKKGVPSPVEFIYYYLEKINNRITQFV